MRAVLLSSVLLACLVSCRESSPVDSVPALSVTPRSLDFGDGAALRRAAETITVSNAGFGAGELLAITILPESPAFGFDIESHEIPPGGNRVLTVWFHPDRIGEFAATLRLETSDQENPEFEIPLTGKASRAANLISPPDVEMGALCEQGEALFSVVLSAAEGDPVEISKLTFTGRDAADFSFASSARTPFTIPAGETVSLRIRWTPPVGAPPEPEAGLTVVSNSLDAPERFIPFKGEVRRIPVAVIRDVAPALPGDVVTFDGQDSNDPGGAALTYEWSLLSAPTGSTVQLETSGASAWTSRLDRPGRYWVSLVVSNGVCDSAPAMKEVVTTADTRFAIELVWNRNEPDLDLHVMPVDEVFGGPRDCYYELAHRRPDWGTAGDTGDDPTLIDALHGPGPEWFSYPAPVAGQYRIVVGYGSANLLKPPTVVATVRITIDNVLKASFQRTLEAEGDLWTVAEVEWPSTNVTGINQLGGAP